MMTEIQNEQNTNNGANNADTDVTFTVEVGDDKAMERLSGPRHENLRAVAQGLHVRIGARGNQLQVVGSRADATVAARLLSDLVRISKRSQPLKAQDINHAVRTVKSNPQADIEAIFLDVVVESRGGKQVTPKGPGQLAYINAMRNHDISFGVGPAGTGKTYLAVALAVAALKAEKVARIILTRPAVEAGEKLGFLPGDLEAKINPYLRPLYDALYDLFGAELAQDLLNRKVVEIAPLAFMRGRTLHDAFVILDEAQNTTREQMKMFLTRLGFGSKMVVTGDPSQIDLPRGTRSGLADALRVLDNVEGVAICRLTEQDVVRHPMVQKVIRAYDRDDRRGVRPEMPAGQPAEQTAADDDEPVSAP